MPLFTATIFKIKQIENKPVYYDSALRDLNEYIDSLPLDKASKERLNNIDFIESNFAFYVYYPYLFAPAFEIENTKIVKLAIAGYLFYRSIIFLDELVDSNKMSFDTMSIVTICQEESIKLLSSIFPLNSEFWKFWNHRRNEYVKAYVIDKVSHNVNSFNEFIVHAGNKSSFGKVAIDALDVLSCGKYGAKLYNAVLKSHQLYYAAFQIIDDVKDIRKDIDQKQFNIAVYYYFKKNNPKDVAPEFIAKQIFISGIATELLKRGLRLLDESEALIKDFKLAEWLIEIKKLYNTLVTQILNIEGYLQYLKTREALSHKVSTDSISSNKVFIASGLNFLHTFQSKNGSFSDYFNDAGISDTWVTAFILSLLSSCEMSDKAIKSRMIARAHAFLHAQKGLWGYNRHWIPDADSSTFVLLASQQTYGIVNKVLLSQWLSYQNQDGGFSTYSDENTLIPLLSTSGQKINCVKGWTQSHLCVSAAAFYLLSSIGDKTKNFFLLKRYILRCQKSDGLWDSFWWTSPIYSTCLIIKSCLISINDDIRKEMNRGINGLIKLQNKNGSFGDIKNPESVFYTSLIIETLCKEKEVFSKNIEPIEKATKWLKSVQYIDGSWPETASMCMPSPDTIMPKEIFKWKISTSGFNILVEDFNRLLSTAAAISAISTYERVINE